MYQVILKFRTDMGNDWLVPKDFQNKIHCNNFINGICKRKGYSLDEVFEVRADRKYCKKYGQASESIKVTSVKPSKD
tara:strand:+ start:7043 stop:7273 length:231 start_codon:yes stop_codon:yes gene_type:complete